MSLIGTCIHFLHENNVADFYDPFSRHKGLQLKTSSQHFEGLSVDPVHL